MDEKVLLDWKEAHADAYSKFKHDLETQLLQSSLNSFENKKELGIIFCNSSIILLKQVKLLNYQYFRAKFTLFGDSYLTIKSVKTLLVLGFLASLLPLLSL